MEDTILHSLAEASIGRMQAAKGSLPRSEYGHFRWQERMITIIGARGTGKTTLMLQRMLAEDPEGKAHIYLALDDIHFALYRLTDTVKGLILLGYTHFYIDEVHKYAEWSRELKGLYDTNPDIQIVFSGSSALEVLKGKADLSRRTIIYTIQGLSFRQYLVLKHGIEMPVLSLDDMLLHANDYINDLPTGFRPYSFLGEYLQRGYYPFFLQSPESVSVRLRQVMRQVVEYDLEDALGFPVQQPEKMLQLLMIVAQSVPFKPNISKLSERIGVSRTTLVQYLGYLERADLIATLATPGKSISTLQKPDKVYLENTNLMYALAGYAPNTGTLRETFVMNQVGFQHTIEYPDKGDFYIDHKYTLEIGGPGKGSHQVQGIKNSFILTDESERAVMKFVPLWLAGMLY